MRFIVNSRFALALSLSAPYSYPYSNSSRRDFTAEAQRGRSRKGARLNTKAPRHKGKREGEVMGDE